MPQQPCTVNEILVPSCGAWLGASTPSGDGAYDYTTGLTEYEKVAQRSPDILHFYKRNAATFPTATEIAAAQRPGQDPKILFYNWKPSTTKTWAAVAAGGADTAIDQVAAGLQAYPHRIFLTIFHEPENDELGAGSGMTATDYVSMYRHVVERLRQGGVTKAVFVMNYMGFSRWASRVDALYPGDDVVDWIAYDPYGFAAETSIDKMLNAPTGAWPGFYSWATTKAPGKPIMLGEWGIEVASQPNAAAILDAAIPVLRNDFPAIKAFVYWNDAVGKLRFRLDEPTAAGASFGAAYARFVANPYFDTNPGGATPIPAPAPPPTTAAPTTPTTIVAPPISQPVAAATGSAALRAVAPCRLVDTRNSNPLASQATFTVVTAGRCNVASNAVGVAVTVTVTDARGGGYATAYPSGVAIPTASILNWSAGQTRANSAYIQLSNGNFNIFTSSAANFVVDVTGYFIPAESSGAGRLIAVAQTRIADTRTDGRVAAGSITTVALPAGVPSDATAVVLTLTATNTVGPGYYTVSAARTPLPLASVLNIDAEDQTRAATITVQPNANGVQIFSSLSSNLIVDIVGYYTGEAAPSGTAGLFIPQTPSRIFDSRADNDEVTPGRERPVNGAGNGSMMVVNVTAIANALTGWGSLFASIEPTPATSSINFSAHEVVANQAVVARSARLSASASTHIVVDQYGTFR